MKHLWCFFLHRAVGKKWPGVPDPSINHVHACSYMCTVCVWAGRWGGAQGMWCTHMSKGAERAQKAQHDKAEDEQLPSLGQVVWVLIQDGCDDGLQPPELWGEHKQTGRMLLALPFHHLFRQSIDVYFEAAALRSCGNDNTLMLSNYSSLHFTFNWVYYKGNVWYSVVGNWLFKQHMLFVKKRNWRKVYFNNYWKVYFPYQ